MRAIRKKFQFNKKYLTIAVYAFIVIALAIILEKALSNKESAETAVRTVGTSLRTLVSPFGYGFLIAYLTNPIVMFLESRFFGKIPFFNERFKARRRISILAAYLIYVVVIAVIIIVIVPEIRNNAVNFFVDIPENYNRLLETVAETIGNTGLITKEEMLSTLSGYSIDLGEIVLDFSYLLKTVMSVTWDVVSVTLNVLMGVFISFYMLANKEGFLKQLTKIMYTFLKENTATRTIHVINRINLVFRKFVLAKAVDSLIIGIIAYVSLSVMDMPLAMMLSVIIGITNMIPYFGPFIGAIPAILIVLFTDPNKTLLVAVFILALQQFDGNFLGPKLLGKSIGINPVWIIFSVIIGGAIGGPVGMVLGVPIFAALKGYFDEYVEKKYSAKFAENPSEEEEKEPVILPRASLIEGYEHIED